MTPFLPRCAKCRRHLQTRAERCPFCASERAPKTARSAAIVASLIALGYSVPAQAADASGDFVEPSVNAQPAQVEPHYGLPPMPNPEPPPDDEEPPPEDDETASP